MYTEKVMDLFKNPQNMKEIIDPDGVGKIGNPVCGDIMWVYIKVGRNKNGEEILDDIGVKTFGCVAAIATSSMITEIAKGMTLERAKDITNKDVSAALGGLPPIKEHCSNLAAKGLTKAIEDYQKKNKGE